MVYKPTYCCNCGDKVDRVEWHIWNSRKYCELCETEFQFDEWWPRAAVFAILIFGFTGFGFHFGSTNEDPGVSTRMLASPKSGPSERTGTSTSAGSSETVKQETPERTTVPVAPKLELKPAEPKREIPAEDIPEEIYYCGAITKKGTPCQRRVKDGGHCWQHKNQPTK